MFLKRVIIFITILMIIWIVIYLVTTNIILTNKKSVPIATEYNELLGWYPIKNLKNAILKSYSGGQYTITTDEFGHRNHLPYSSDLEYLVQGDSNIFGYGLQYEDTLCYKLNKMTNKKFYNFGVLGFDVNHYYFQYNIFRNKFSIKNRVIFFNIGNDFTLTMYGTAYLRRRPYLEVRQDGIFEYTNNISRIKKQIYGYKFIEKYKKYNPLVAFLNLGRDWGDDCPKWVYNISALLFLQEKIYSLMAKIVKYFYPREKAEIAKFLNPYYPDWLLLKKEFWPKPYREYADDFKKIMGYLKKTKREYLRLYIADANPSNG